MPVIIRDDDTGFFTRPAMLEALYGTLWDAGLPVCLAVIPAHDASIRISAAGDAFYDPNIPTRYQGAALRYPITDNAALCDFLNGLARRGLVEICLHGYTHTWLEFGSEDAESLGLAIRDGLAILRSALPDAHITTFVPPYESLSSTALSALFDAGLHVTVQAAALSGFPAWADVQPMRVYRTSGHSALITGTPIDPLTEPDRWLACVDAHPTHPIVATQHCYQFFEDYGPTIPARRAVWERISAQLLAAHRTAFTTFQQVAAGHQ